MTRCSVTGGRRTVGLCRGVYVNLLLLIAGSPTDSGCVLGTVAKNAVVPDQVARRRGTFHPHAVEHVAGDQVVADGRGGTVADVDAVRAVAADQVAGDLRAAAVVNIDPTVGTVADKVPRTTYPADGVVRRPVPNADTPGPVAQSRGQIGGHADGVALDPVVVGAQSFDQDTVIGIARDHVALPGAAAADEVVVRAVADEPINSSCM